MNGALHETCDATNDTVTTLRNLTATAAALGCRLIYQCHGGCTIDELLLAGAGPTLLRLRGLGRRRRARELFGALDGGRLRPPARAPLADAAYAGGIWTRAFASGTTVSLTRGRGGGDPVGRRWLGEHYFTVVMLLTMMVLASCGLLLAQPVARPAHHQIYSPCRPPRRSVNCAGSSRPVAPWWTRPARNRQGRCFCLHEAVRPWRSSRRHHHRSPPSASCPSTLSTTSPTPAGTTRSRCREGAQAMGMLHGDAMEWSDRLTSEDEEEARKERRTAVGVSIPYDAHEGGSAFDAAGVATMISYARCSTCPAGNALPAVRAAAAAVGVRAGEGGEPGDRRPRVLGLGHPRLGGTPFSNPTAAVRSRRRSELPRPVDLGDGQRQHGGMTPADGIVTSTETTRSPPCCRRPNVTRSSARTSRRSPT